MLLGYNNTDAKYDLQKAHIAKFDLIQRYLDALPESDDQDLAIIVDGYDIVFQLPAEILIQRYFALVADSDARLAEKYSLSVSEAHARGLRNTIFWGADKICFPPDENAPRCWAVPPSSLPDEAFGFRGDNHSMELQDPRWLNSGTVIGPIGDLRRYIAAILKLKEETFDPEYHLRNSDQLYFAEAWAKQEYFRAVEVGGKPPDGPARRFIPPRRRNENTELHVSIDYESALFQPRAGNDPYYGPRMFDAAGGTAIIDQDTTQQGDEFVPYPIHMPSAVYNSLAHLYSNIPHLHKGVKPRDWVRSLPLSVNFITQNIFAVWHCTAEKVPVHEQYHTWWFYPMAKSLQKAAVKEQLGRNSISDLKIDGRTWSAKTVYPNNTTDALGGAWSDEGHFLPWSSLCEKHDDFLYRGETSAENGSKRLR